MAQLWFIKQGPNQGGYKEGSHTGLFLVLAVKKNIITAPDTKQQLQNHIYRNSSAYAVFRDSGKPCKQKTALLEE